MARDRACSQVQGAAHAVSFQDVLLSRLRPANRACFLCVAPFVAEYERAVMRPRGQAGLRAFVNFTRLYRTVDARICGLAEAGVFFCFMVGVEGAAQLAHNDVYPLFLAGRGQYAPPSIANNGGAVFYRRGRETKPFSIFMRVLSAFGGDFSLSSR